MMRRAQRTRTVVVDLSDVEGNRAEQLKSMPLKSVLSELMHSIRAYVNIKFDDRSVEERERLVRAALDAILKLNDSSHSLERRAGDSAMETDRSLGSTSDRRTVEVAKFESPNLVTKIVRLLESKSKAVNSALPNAASISAHGNMRMTNKAAKYDEGRKITIQTQNGSNGNATSCLPNNCKSCAVHEAPVSLKKEGSSIITERTNDFLSILRFFENK